MSDPFAVDRLREQLVDAVMPDAERWGYPEDAFDGAKAFADASLPIIIALYTDHLIRRLLPIVAAYGDAREAAGREQAAQAMRGLQPGDTVVCVDDDGGRISLLGRGETSVVRWSSEPGPEQLVIMQDCNAEWSARRFSLARGSGVAVQPTPGKRP
jgi:hypothetical protein